MFGCAVSGYGQAKVGTSGAQFLNISPSVRANGMGQVGVAVADYNSFYSNPSEVALLAENDYIFFSTYVKHVTNPPGFAFSSFSAGISSHLRPFQIGVAYYRTRMGMSIEVPSYEEVGDTSFTFKDVANNFVVGAAYSGIVRIGIGATFKRITESSNDNQAEGNAFDFGFLIQGSQESRLGSTAQETEWKLVTIPSLGFAWCNYGDKLLFERHDYPLPKTSKAGFSLELALDYHKFDNPWRIVTLLFAAETSENLAEDSDSRTNYGMESVLFDAVALRIGRVYPEMTTSGLTVSSFGIARIITELINKDGAGSKGIESLFSEHLGFEYSFAHYEASAEFHELSMIWRF
jgi:hypothetical protein